MAIYSFAILMLVLVGISLIQAQNPYCSIKTCYGTPPGENTLCKYSNTTWGTACQPAYPDKSTVSAADITIILKAHNDYRRKVAQGLETLGNPGPQPPASNMREMKWDQELSVMAAAHAQQCVWKHDTCRDVPRFQVGQNNYLMPSAGDHLGTANWNNAVTAWYNEVKDMNPAHVPNFQWIRGIAHYSQVVWANTYLVGCATAYYQSTALYGEKYPYNRIQICNYGPAGNYRNSTVYAQGAAGSACPTGTVNNNGLCA